MRQSFSRFHPSANPPPTVLSLLSPCRVPGRTPTNQLYQRSSSLPSDSSDGSSSGPSSPTDRDVAFAGMSPWQGGISTSVICIDIVPDNPSYSSSPVSSQFSFGYPHSLNDNSSEVRLSQQPRPIRSIDPTLTFLSHTAISATSIYTVFVNGTTVHSEVAPLSQRPSRSDADGSYVYSTTLVPSYWQTIVASEGGSLSLMSRSRL